MTATTLTTDSIQNNTSTQQCHHCNSTDITTMSGVLFCMQCGHKIQLQNNENTTNNIQIDENVSKHTTPDKSTATTAFNSATKYVSPTVTEPQPSQPNYEFDINSIADKITLESPVESNIVLLDSTDNSTHVTPAKPVLTVNTAALSTLKPTKTPRQVTPKTSILSPDSTNKSMNHDIITMTTEQYEQLINDIKSEAATQSQHELQLLSTEIDSLHTQLKHAEAEKFEYSQLADTAVNQYETTLQQSITYKAELDLLQHELHNSRQQYDAVKSENNALNNELQAVLIQFDNTAANERVLQESHRQLQAQYTLLKQQFDELSDQAHDKLTEGARVYSIEVNKVAQLTTERDTLYNDNKRYQTQINELKQRLHTTEQRTQSLQHDNDRLTTELHDINTQCTQLKTQIEQLYVELNELQRVSDESQRTSKVYREQIIDYKEKLRLLESDNKNKATVVQQTQSITAELEQLKTQNSTLKAQLFDQMSNATPDEKQLLQQISLLTTELNNKTNELTELSAVLQPLIDEVEELRAKCGITQ